MAREEAAVDDGSVIVRDDGCGNVPALPAGVRSAIGEVDVLAVHAEARVEAAELVEHLASKEEKRAEQPVGFDRLRMALVEVVVRTLRVRSCEPPQRRAAD